jgi:lactoylglutathione lyase
MLRISDMAQSTRFYTEILGMKLLRILEQPKEKYTLLFFGYAAESQSAVIELTYNYGQTKYDMGNGFGHIAIGVEDIKKTIHLIKSLGHPIDLAPKKLKGSHETIAFITDPDGYKIELIERISHAG